MIQRVADASPLIFLGKLDRLDLLLLGVGAVLVPDAVLMEVRAKRDEATERIEGLLGAWLGCCSLQGNVAVGLLSDLAPGERDVIAQAVEQRIESVVIDDLDARRVARRAGLRPVGTVGLLLAAKQLGLVPCLGRELDRLAAEGFRASDALLRAALGAAGEG